MHGEARLLAHEREIRYTEGKLRREARIDLARQGRVGTESEIAKWKEERAARIQSEQQQRLAAPSSSSDNLESPASK